MRPNLDPDPLLVVTVVGFLLFLFAPLLPPLVMRGRKHRLMIAWALVMLLMAVSPILSPSFALDLWYLWAITLSVPLSLISVSQDLCDFCEKQGKYGLSS